MAPFSLTSLTGTPGGAGQVEELVLYYNKLILISIRYQSKSCAFLYHSLCLHYVFREAEMKMTPYISAVLYEDIF